MSQQQETSQAQGSVQAYNVVPDYRVLDQQKAVLPRSISTTNLETTSRCRSAIKNDWRANAPVGGTNYFATTPGYTLILPALDDYPNDFQKFVFSRIVAKDTQESMEKEFCLNWCPSVTKLVPLCTTGDGNCLLHAASLAMWGFQDRDFVLRKAVSHAVNDEIHNNTLYQRWKHNREMENQQEYGLELEPHQWDQEWQMVRQQTLMGQSIDSLDEFHTFVLANVLRRPIVMYAIPKLRSHQTDGTLQKINFHGVYLPLLWAPDSCKKDPLPLAYHLGHFSALVVVESAQQYRDGQLLLPLSDYYSQQLPVRFALPVEDPNTLMMDYLDLVQVPIKGSPYFSGGNIICAKMTISDVPSYLKPLISGFINTCYEAYSAQRQQNHLMAEPISADGQNRPLCINNCGMYGDPATGLCSKCHQKAIGAAQAQEKAAFEEVPQQPQGQFQHHVNEQPHLPNVATGGVSGAIKCPRCTNPGHPSFLGMCEHCFKSKSTKQSVPSASNEREQQQRYRTENVSQQGKDPVYEVLPNYQASSQEAKSLSVQHPPALPPPRNTGDGPVERSQCRTPGCEFFGTRESRFYCSKCFESNMKSILEELDSSNIPKIPADPHQLPSSDDGIKEPTIISFPPVLPGPIKEPSKCYKCRKFFASDEYNGMCHGCFMKMTTVDSLGDVQQSQWGKAQTEPKYSLQAMKSIQQFEQRCNSARCINPATENGYCEYCNVASARPSTCQQPQTQIPPIPKPRSKVTTQPVTSSPMLTSSMVGMSVSANESSKCFLCTGGYISASNFVCEHHARIMQEMQKVAPSQYGRDSHTQPSSDTRIATYQKNASPYEEPSLSKSPEFKQSLQTKVSSGVGGDVPFGVPLSAAYNTGPVLSASHAGKLAGPSEYLAESLQYQGNYLQANSQLEAAQSHGQNRFGANSAHTISTGGMAAGETVATGGNPPQKTLCATPGCSFKGYDQLHKLCPDCYQEKYPGFPLV